ncbi:TetR/AcrR family transcriptional regulator [Nocardia farcinica]|uniref:TetR/AcrR family transcriptional regulator n=1 Tax=Nocardia farcinica TaxID=37329 RepID=UPI0018936F40|nr:TetR/AcrR family transcriptional regulator [Nocardia farcinica]MBF6376050.1 TetR/AcrR family transcriptional regulator [Nocardia farcinica]MBF6540487.1 TetR/AcrR family transcriptional regulator [Nocardia farcinica]
MRPPTTQRESLSDSEFADRHRAVREAVLTSPRGRLIAAIVDCVETKGYPATTLSDIVARARVSRSTFYEHFANKEHCFVEAVHAGIDILAARINGELAQLPRDAEPRAKIASVITTFCETVAAEPGFARLVLVEAFRVERAAEAVRNRAVDRFTDLYRHFHAVARAGDPSVPPVSAELISLIPDAVGERTRRLILTDGPEAVPRSAPLFIAFTTTVLGLD